MPAGDVEIQSTIAPKNDGAFPVARARNIMGGFRSVDDVAARDAIPPLHRETGMKVRTVADSKEWVLNGDLATWTEYAPGGGGGGPATGEYPCAADVVPGVLVYIDAGGVAQKAIATTEETLAIGVVAANPAPLRARVQYDGEASVFVGLTPRKVHFLSALVAGTASDVAPSTLGQFVQRVGYARDSVTLVVMTDGDFVAL